MPRSTRCPQVLGPKGFCGVQVSPPMEHVQVSYTTTQTGCESTPVVSVIYLTIFFTLLVLASWFMVCTIINTRKSGGIFLAPAEGCNGGALRAKK